MARDIPLNGVLGLDSGRTTMDVDLAVAVEDWAQFDLVKARLVATNNVAGYREVFAAALEVEVSTGLVVRVASLPGLAILKLFAWADRGLENPKDALDLGALLRSYGAAGNEERLFGEEVGLLEALDYDMDLAGPRLLGKDAGQLATPETRNKILALLDDVSTLERLLRDMAKGLRGADDAIGEAERLIAQFRIGLRESDPTGAGPP